MSKSTPDFSHFFVIIESMLFRQRIYLKSNRSECASRQNARLRVRFDEIFAYFSSNGKVSDSPA